MVALGSFCVFVRSVSAVLHACVFCFRQQARVFYPDVPARDFRVAEDASRALLPRRWFTLAFSFNSSDCTPGLVSEPLYLSSLDLSCW